MHHHKHSSKIEKNKKYQTNLKKNQRNYTITLYEIQEKIQITIKYLNMDSDEIYEFTNFYSMNQLRIINKYFKYFDTLGQICRDLDKLLKKNKISLEEKKSNMILSIYTHIKNEQTTIIFNLFQNKINYHKNKSKLNHQYLYEDYIRGSKHKNQSMPKNINNEARARYLLNDSKIRESEIDNSNINDISFPLNDYHKKHRNSKNYKNKDKKNMTYMNNYNNIASRLHNLEELNNDKDKRIKELEDQIDKYEKDISNTISYPVYNPATNISQNTKIESTNDGIKDNINDNLNDNDNDNNKNNSKESEMEKSILMNDKSIKKIGENIDNKINRNNANIILKEKGKKLKKNKPKYIEYELELSAEQPNKNNINKSKKGSDKNLKNNSHLRENNSNEKNSNGSKNNKNDVFKDQKGTNVKYKFKPIDDYENENNQNKLRNKDNKEKKYISKSQKNFNDIKTNEYPVSRNEDNYMSNSHKLTDSNKKESIKDSSFTKNEEKQKNFQIDDNSEDKNSDNENDSNSSKKYYKNNYFDFSTPYETKKKDVSSGIPLVHREDLRKIIDSRIFFTKNELKFVEKKLTKGKKNLHAFFFLLYRASIDGDFEDTLISMCEGAYPQLILFYTNGGARFGVYIEKEKVTSFFGDVYFKEIPGTSFLVSLNSLKTYDINKGQIASDNRPEKLCFGRTYLFNENKSNWFIYTPRNQFLDIQCRIGDKKSTFGEIDTDEIVGTKKDYYLKDVEIFKITLQSGESNDFKMKELDYVREKEIKIKGYSRNSKKRSRRNSDFIKIKNAKIEKEDDYY